MEQQLTIRSKELELAATLHVPFNITKKGKQQTSLLPLIIICHGFVGNRIGVDRLFVKAARELSSSGFMVLRFDYGGCGESTGDYGAGGLDALIEQTRHVIDYGLQIDGVDPDRLILLGHSLGGAVSLLTAARDSRVKSLVLWSAVAHPFQDITRIVGKKVYEESLQKGVADYLGYSFQPQFFNSLSRFHPFQEAKHFSGDVLLIHGTDDDVIPVEYCFLYQKLFSLENHRRCEKEIIFHADHTYSSGETFCHLLTRTKDWLFRLDRQNHAVNE